MGPGVATPLVNVLGSKIRLYCCGPQSLHFIHTDALLTRREREGSLGNIREGRRGREHSPRGNVREERRGREGLRGNVREERRGREGSRGNVCEGWPSGPPYVIAYTTSRVHYCHVLLGALPRYGPILQRDVRV